MTARRHVVAVVGPGDSGGLGGVMAAAARGARAAGGLTIGLLPGDDAAAADPAMDVVLPTGLGEARNALVVKAAEVVVAVGGSWGTLSEIALARRTGRPVVSLHGWDVTGLAADEIYRATDAADAVRAATSLLASAPS